ncbi:unnamed protein product [[Candida] boidinii]|nr:unnamed protein product [[Candida] boidinii]
MNTSTIPEVDGKFKPPPFEEYDVMLSELVLLLLLLFDVSVFVKSVLSIDCCESLSDIVFVEEELGEIIANFDVVVVVVGGVSIDS